MDLLPWRRKALWWEPISEIESIQDEMNKIFNLSLSRFPGKGNILTKGTWIPPMDIVDSKDKITVKMDIPGIKKDNLEVSIENNNLIVKGEKEEEKEVNEKDYIRTERYYGSFNRVVSLPTEVDSSNINAIYKNGVLELTLPKKEGAKPKAIKVDVK